MRTGAAVGLVKIFRDHTEKLQAKEALEKSLQETERARAEAEAAGRAKDHFLAVLSHELRTPLTPVLMSVDTLMLRSDLPAQVVEGLDMIQRNVTLEAQFIDELLDLTRISRGKFELSPEPMSLHEAIRLAAEVAAPDVKEKSQRLVCELDAENDHLTGDFKRLQQVFWNLLKNASKFTPERGGITVRSRNEPATPDAPPRIVVEVSDTGIGFEADAAERIFDAFTQANETITQEFGGLGLGLAISKATVDAHQRNDPAPAAREPIKAPRLPSACRLRNSQKVIARVSRRWIATHGCACARETENKNQRYRALRRLFESKRHRRTRRALQFDRRPEQIRRHRGEWKISPGLRLPCSEDAPRPPQRQDRWRLGLGTG